MGCTDMALSLLLFASLFMTPLLMSACLHPSCSIPLPTLVMIMLPLGENVLFLAVRDHNDFYPTADAF